MEVLAAKSAASTTSHHRVRVHSSVVSESTTPAVISVAATVTTAIAGVVLVLEAVSTILDIWVGMPGSTSIVITIRGPLVTEGRAVWLPRLSGSARLVVVTGTGTHASVQTSIFRGEVRTRSISGIIDSDRIRVDLHDIVRRVLDGTRGRQWRGLSCRLNGAGVNRA
jgi:hypothetical protein